MSFATAKTAMVDKIFDVFGEPICVDDGNMVETVIGIYKLNSDDFFAGEAIIAGAAASVRLMNADIARFCLTKTSNITADGVVHTAVLPIHDKGDGTSIVQLRIGRS